MPRQRKRTTDPEIRFRNMLETGGLPGMAGRSRLGTVVGRGLGASIAAIDEATGSETSGAAQLLVLSASGASIAPGGDFVEFDSIVAQVGFDGVIQPQGGYWVHPISGVYMLTYEHRWDSYDGGGTVSLEIDGVRSPANVVAIGSAGAEGRGVIAYVALGGSIGRIHVDHDSASAQTCDAVVRSAITDPRASAEPVTGLYWTDFATDTIGGTYTVGQVPSGWSRLFGSADDWIVDNFTGATAGRVLRCPSGAASNAMGWVEPGAGATTEVVARVRSQISNDRARVSMRVSGDGQLAYEATLNPDTNEFQLFRWNGTSRTELARRSMSVSSGSWYWIRARADGATLRAKAWSSSGSEPSDWQLSATDTSPIQTGYVGVGPTGETASGRLIDVLGLAFGGATAPMTNPLV